MVSERSKETLGKLENGTYRNNRTITLGGIDFTAKDVLVKAPLVSRLNCYYVGGTGEGKTQLANDICGYLKDSSCYSMGRPDFEPSELFRSLNLGFLTDLLKGKKTNPQLQQSLEKLSGNVDKCFFYVDELNRCPPIVQNYFFDFFDGKLVYNGQLVNLGKDGYSVGFASGNLGDGQFCGTSDTDRALKDRMHMIVSLDNTRFSPTEGDVLSVLTGRKTPRARQTNDSSINIEDIIELNREFQETDIHPIYPILGLYLTRGLDFLQDHPEHSKKNIFDSWYHSNPESVRQDTDEGLIFPISVRAALASQALASGLEFIADAKGEEVTDHTGLFLDALKLTIPYSGVLNPMFVNQKHGGNVYTAFDEAMEYSRAGINEREEGLTTAIAFAEAGLVNEVEPILGEIAPPNTRWESVANGIRQYAEECEENPTKEGQKLRDIIRGAYEEEN